MSVQQGLHIKCRDTVQVAGTRTEHCAESHAVIGAENMQKLTADMIHRRIVIKTWCNQLTS